MTAFDNITEEVIQHAAYYNWLNAGKPEGRDEEFWLAAEQAFYSANLDITDVVFEEKFLDSWWEDWDGGVVTMSAEEIASALTSAAIH